MRDGELLEAGRKTVCLEGHQKRCGRSGVLIASVSQGVRFRPQLCEVQRVLGTGTAAGGATVRSEEVHEGGHR